MPPRPPQPWRPPLAALLAGAAVLLLGPPPGPLAGFGVSLPVLALLGGLLRRRSPGAPAAAAAAALLLVPALALGAWQISFAWIPVGHVDATTALYSAVEDARTALGGRAGLLAGAAAATLALGGAGPAGTAATAAAVAVLAQAALLSATLEALEAGDPGGAAATAEAARLAWVAVLLVAPWRAMRRGAWPHLAPVALAAAAALDPLPPLVRALPVPATEVAVPRLEPGLSPALPAVSPDRLAAALEARGLHDEGRFAPDCPSPDRDAWLRAPRATVALAMPAAATVAELDRVLLVAGRHLVRTVVLVGRADAPPPGLLRAHLAWPGTPLRLDAPPPSAPTAAVFGPTPTWLEEPPRPGERAVCVLLPSPDLPVRDLVAAARRVAGPASSRRCAATVLLPGDPRPRTLLDAKRALQYVERPCR